MTADHWECVVDLFSAAVGRSPEDRRTFLDGACADNPELRAEIEQLLADHALAETAEFMNAPPWVIDEIAPVLPDFENYSAIEYIGHGGMGIVYQAFDASLDTFVALKISLPHCPSTDSEISFHIDPQSMAKLKHPNFVQVHKVGEHDSRPYFTMNLIRRKDGAVSLAQHLDRFQKDPSAAATLMIKVARAVHHAHQRGILHRDLKPGNILLDDDDDPHVTDFGLAKQIGVDTPSAEVRGPLTSSTIAHHRIVGTVGYMSPEQADPVPDREVTTLCDVYGLGATLYTLLTGQPPFRCESLQATLQDVRDFRRKPRPPRETNNRIDYTLESICLKCLEKIPGQRYRSAEGLARNLERWLHHESGIEPLQPPRVKFWNWCRRSPGAAVLSAVTALLLVLSTAMASLAARSTERTLVEVGGRINTRDAERLADNFRWILELLGRKVLETAEDNTVRQALRTAVDVETAMDAHAFLNTGAGQVFQARANELFKQHNRELEERFKESGSPEFATSFFFNRLGTLVAYAGPPGRGPEIIGEHFNQRDYFIVSRAYAESGRRGMSALHVSRAFMSQYDDYFKFAISIPVLDDDGSFLGVVEASIPMDAQLGLPGLLLQGEDQKVALAGRVDQNPVTEGAKPLEYMQHELLILLHESLEAEPTEDMRKMFFPLDEKSNRRDWPDIDRNRPELDMSQQRIEPDEDYSDPLSRKYPQKYGGRWLAGFGQVGNTELVVVVQQPYARAIEAPTALARRFVSWGWGALGLACTMAGVVVWHIRQLK